MQKKKTVSSPIQAEEIMRLEFSRNTQVSPVQSAISPLESAKS